MLRKITVLLIYVIVGMDYPFAGSVVPTQCLKAVRTSEEISDLERKVFWKRMPWRFSLDLARIGVRNWLIL